MEEQERKQSILDAALEEFANKGFRSATIKSIAKAAKLKSPSLIYWYFPTKEALFQGVLTSRLSFLQSVLSAESHLDDPPEVVLPQLATSYLSMLDDPVRMKLFKLLLSEVSKRKSLADLVGNNLMLHVLGFLQTYFERQIELGRMRPHDVTISSRAFLGMLIPKAVGKMLIPALESDELDDETYITGVIEVFLRGLMVEDPPSAEIS